jgi:hypothetical protein
MIEMIGTGILFKKNKKEPEKNSTDESITEM